MLSVTSVVCLNSQRISMFLLPTQPRGENRLKRFHPCGHSPYPRAQFLKRAHLPRGPGSFTLDPRAAAAACPRQNDEEDDKPSGNQQEEGDDAQKTSPHHDRLTSNGAFVCTLVKLLDPMIIHHVLDLGYRLGDSHVKEDRASQQSADQNEQSADE